MKSEDDKSPIIDYFPGTADCPPPIFRQMVHASLASAVALAFGIGATEIAWKLLDGIFYDLLLLAAITFFSVIGVLLYVRWRRAWLGLLVVVLIIAGMVALFFVAFA